MPSSASRRSAWARRFRAPSTRLPGLPRSLDGLHFVRLRPGGPPPGDSSASARRCSTVSRACAASSSRSPSRFFSASLRAAADGASAAVVKPSQRQRSPSRETSLWPGFKASRSRKPSALLDDADLVQPALQGRRGRGDRGEGGDAVGARRDRSSPAPVSAQWAGAEALVEASRSSPSAAPRAVSIALLHGNLVKSGRPQVAALRGEELGERARFGFELLRLALGLVQGLPQAALGLAGGGQFFAGGHDGLFGLLDRVLRHRHVFAQQVDGRRIVGRRATSAAMSRSTRSFSEAKRAARSISSRIGRSRAARRAFRSEVWA